MIGDEIPVALDEDGVEPSEQSKREREWGEDSPARRAGQHL